MSEEQPKVAQNSPTRRLGGRQKGTPNKRTQDFDARLHRLKCDPLSLMTLIVRGEVPCNVCRGKGKTPYRKKDRSLGERTCESCYGSTFEIISPVDRGKTAAELLKYQYPQRKAVEVSGSLELTGSIAQRLAGGRERLARERLA